MYLSELKIKNFRCFDESDHVIKFNKGLNVLVGENDSGKSAIIDSIRYVLGTTDMTWNRLSPEEFYNENTSLEIEIICKFQDLSIEEKAAFIECLSYEGVKKEIECLYINWKGSYLNTYNPPRTITRMTTGKDGNGNILSSEARELLRVTYLHALRDAYSEMSSGKNSRLSRVMQNISNIDTGNDIYNHGDDLEDLSVLGIANLSNDLLSKHKILSAVNLDMTSIIKEKMLLETDSFTTKLEVAGSNLNDKRKVMSLLEKLDLTVDKDSSSLMGRVGLGTSNVMSMACELLLHKDTKSNNKPCFLLIEEPEAHIHAQRQLKLIESLEDDSETNNIQVILTTHSPLLASVVKLSNVIFVKKGKTYSLSKEYTNLNEDDYVYLEKYLDATKSNLFFARSVVIVEGPGEALLLPTIAKLLGCSFTNYGVSLIDVRSTGLRRYARIFQRKNDGELLDINVSCITDRDIMPDCAPQICINENYNGIENWPDKNKRNWKAESDFSDDEKVEYLSTINSKASGQSVKTFISEHWTLEYDLAYKGLQDTEMTKILTTSLINVSYKPINRDKKNEELNNKLNGYESIEEKASYFYSYFTSKKASKADFAQEFSINLEKKYSNKDSNEIERVIPKYLVEAIKYVTKGE